MHKGFTLKDKLSYSFDTISYPDSSIFYSYTGFRNSSKRRGVSHPSLDEPHANNGSWNHRRR